MNPTHPYWEPPTDFQTRKTLKPIARDLGFQFNIPWPLPVSAGYYFGENPPPGRKELVYDSRPEWYAVDNVIPSTAGIPLMNPYTEEMKFDRSKYTQQVLKGKVQN